MLAMNMNSVSIGYGSPSPGVADHACASARARRAARPRRTPCRCAAACRRRRPAGPPGPAGSRAARRAAAVRRRPPGLPAGFGPGGIGFGIRRLVAPAAGHIDRAEQHLQQVQRAAGLEAVASGPRCRASRGTRPGGRASSRARPAPARSRAGRSSIACVEGDVGDLGASGGSRGRDAAALGRPPRARIRVEIALGEQLEDRHGAAAVGQRAVADHHGRRRRSASRSRAPPSRSEHQRLAGLVAREQPVIGAARGRGSPARRRWCSGRG